MEPIGLLTSGKKGWQIVHRCLKCQKQIINYSAEDDNSDQLIKLSLKQNLGYK
jgi:6-phosphogluconate dehydrogenase (decarboxylating)